MTDPTCLFCKIVARTIPSHLVYEDMAAYAFLDIGPFEEGHTLVIPKYHAITLPELPEEQFLAMAPALHRVAALLTKKLGADGFNILQSNGACATQIVPHVHFHVIPRWNDRPLCWTAQPVTQDVLAALAARIRA